MCVSGPDGPNARGGTGGVRGAGVIFWAKNGHVRNFSQPQSRHKHIPLERHLASLSLSLVRILFDLELLYCYRD